MKYVGPKLLYVKLPSTQLEDLYHQVYMIHQHSLLDSHLFYQVQTQMEHELGTGPHSQAVICVMIWLGTSPHLKHGFQHGEAVEKLVYF